MTSGGRGLTCRSQNSTVKLATVKLVCCLPGWCVVRVGRLIQRQSLHYESRQWRNVACCVLAPPLKNRPPVGGPSPFGATT